MNKELKLCPFCGGKASVEDRVEYYIVRCNNRFLPNDDNILCPMNARTHKAATKELAIEFWNTRSNN